MRILDTFLGGKRVFFLNRLVLLFLIFLLQTLSISTIHAADVRPIITLETVFTDPHNPVTQAYFVMNGSSPLPLQNSVRISNSGNASGTINLYPVDAFTAASGGTAFQTRKSPRLDVGAWIVLSRQRVTLAPGQSQIVPFHLTIPPHARSGQHVGGIVGEEVTMQSIETGKNKQRNFHIDLQQLHVIAVQVNLPGTPIEKLIVTSIHADNKNIYQRIQIGLRNMGNMMVKSYGTLQIFDLTGKLLQNQDLRLNTFLPQTSINDQIYIQHKALPAGQYKASLQLTYGHKHYLSYTTMITIVQKKNSIASAISALTSLNDNENILSSLSPWQIAIGGGILLLILCGLYSLIVKLFKMIGHIRSKKKQKKAFVYVPGTPTQDITHTKSDG
jgi:Bacterial protein of unknown function (DUF916)